jgi:hypothetical protein
MRGGAGFINVLSHAYETLQQDPRGPCDLYQGVTTKVFGEGWLLGPVTPSGHCAFHLPERGVLITGDALDADAEQPR